MENIVRLRADETENATVARQVALACCVDLPDGGWTERRLHAVAPGSSNRQDATL